MNLKKVMRQRVQSEAKRRRQDRYIVPTDEQLLNFVCVALGCVSDIERDIVSYSIKNDPLIKNRWLETHKTLCESVGYEG